MTFVRKLERTESLTTRLATWRKTGIASLRDFQLTDIPIQLYEVGKAVRVADLGGNAFVSLSPTFSTLVSLQVRVCVGK